MYCKNCHVPLRNLKDGYYRTTRGVYYCRECYLSIKSEFRIKANTHRSIAQQIQLLQQRINRADYQIFINNYSLEHYHVRLDAPYYIKDMVAEMNKLYLQNKNTDWIGGDIDLANAHYFESQNAETIYNAQKIEEEERKRIAAEEERRKKAEEEEQRKKAIEEENRKKAEEEEQRKKAIEDENRKKAEEARKARIIEEQKRKEREEAEKKRRIFRENEQAVINGKKSYNGRIITEQEILALAMHSQNEKVIKKLARSKNIVILETLKKNTLVSVKTIDKINKRLSYIKNVSNYGFIKYWYDRCEDYFDKLEEHEPKYPLLYWPAMVILGLIITGIVCGAAVFIIYYIALLFAHL